MPSARACPSSEVLESFLLGQMVGLDADALERHLEHCEHCLRKAAAVRAEDYIVATARQVQLSPIESPPGWLVDGLIQRCAHLAQDTHVDPAASTSPLSSPSVQEKIEFDFLSPAEGPGEIGRLGTYRVLQVLGAGGMGVVFLAEDTQLGRPVALKVIRPGLAAGKEARERFLRESRAAAAVKHDHVVTIYHVGEERGMPFLAMEYLQGETLEARLRRQGPLTLAEMLLIGGQIAEGLAAAHSRGMTHRDIKPSNIWLEERAEPRSRNPCFRIKILDFGLARSLVDSRMTHSGQFIGTPAYMAPEQAQGRLVDDRADLFSLGCVLYEMAAGVAPFSRPDTMATLLALANFHPPLLIDHNRAVPAALSTLVDRLLAKDPRNRPASAQEVMKSLWEIERALPSGASFALEPATSKDAQRRHSNFLMTLMLFVVFIFGASAFVIWYDWNGWQSLLPNMQPPNTKTAPRARSRQARPAVWPIDSLQRNNIPEQQLRIAGHGDPSQAPAELVAVLGDGQLRHWNGAFGLGTGVDGVAFSADGQLLASAGGDHMVRIWDISDGRLVRTFVGHRAAVVQVTFAPESRELASADVEGTVIVWEIDTGRARQSFTAPTGPVWSLAFSSDGQWLAWGCENGQIRLWQPAVGGEPETLSGHSNTVVLVFVPNSSTLVSGGTDGLLKLWDLGDVAEPKTLRTVNGRVQSVACSNDGRQLAYGVVAEGVAGVKLLDVTTWQDLQSLDVKPGQAADLAFSTDGKVLACANHNILVRRWETETGRELPALIGHKAGTSSVAFHPDGRRVVSGSWEGAIRLWDSVTGKELFLRMGHDPRANGLAFSHDGLVLASGGMDATIKLWDLATGRELRTLTSHQGEVSCLEFRGDDQLLASGSFDGTIKLWDTKNWKLRTLAGHQGEVRGVAFNEDGGTLASAGATAVLWDTGTAQEVRTLSSRAGNVNGVAWSPDNRMLAITSPDHGVKLWDEASGLPIKHLAGHEDTVQSVAYSPDGALLVSSGTDQTLRLWNPQTGELIRTLMGHEAHVHAVSFRPDGEMIASAAFDGTVRLWNPFDGSCLKVIRLAHPGGNVYRVAFSPDGRHLATANGNGTAYILRLAPLP